MASLKDMADYAARYFGIPENLFSNLIGSESTWKVNAVSDKGAVGLGQLLQGTAADMGVKDRTDPFQNLMGSAKYLKMLYEDKNKDWYRTLIAYHDGPNASTVSSAGKAQADKVISQSFKGAAPSSDPWSIDPKEAAKNLQKNLFPETEGEKKEKESGKSSSWFSTDKYKDMGVDLIFVFGGMALIIASIYTAMRGQSLPSLVVNAGKVAASV